MSTPDPEASVGIQQPRISASPLFLREDELRHGLEMLFFGYTRLTGAIDAQLAEAGLGRAHHRALYFIARQPDISIGNLLAILGITKQSLNRVLAELIKRDLVATREGPVDRRQKLLRLSEAGAQLEAELFAILRYNLARAYARAGQESVTGFWHVLDGLVPAGERDLIPVPDSDS